MFSFFYFLHQKSTEWKTYGLGDFFSLYIHNWKEPHKYFLIRAILTFPISEKAQGHTPFANQIRECELLRKSYINLACATVFRHHKIAQESQSKRAYR